MQFVSFVLDDTQKTWTQILSSEGVPYRHAKLVLFRDSINSACGMAQSATGPFYCPEDEKVYIDLGFFDELKQRFGAPGEFSEAYVLAHEIGHHIQKLTGIEQKVHAAQERDPRSANQLSVRLELQADCFAGVWGHSTSERNLLEPGEVQQGLNAAAAVGDDRLQRMSRGHVNPDSFTHGSSQQRMEWFQKGYSSGDMNAVQHLCPVSPEAPRHYQRVPACAKLQTLPPCAADAFVGNIKMFPTATLPGWPFAHNPRRQDSLNTFSMEIQWFVCALPLVKA